MQCIWCNKIVEEYTAAAEKQTEPHVYEVSALAYKGLLGEGENRPEPGPGYVHKTRGMRAKPSHLLPQTGKQRPSRFARITLPACNEETPLHTTCMMIMTQWFARGRI